MKAERPKYRLSVMADHSGKRGLAVWAVLDRDGYQVFPKPGMSETRVACDEYLRRVGAVS